MTDLNDKLKKRISALIAKAEGTDNINEAKTFMTKAMELLEKHNIERFELGLIDEDNPLGEQFATSWPRSNGWRVSIASAVARLYYCELWYQRRHKKDTIANIVGRLGNRSTFKIMYPFIMMQCRKEAKRLNEDRALEKVSGALVERIYALIHARERNEGKGGQMAVALYDEVKGFLDAKDGLKLNSRALVTSDAARAAAKRVSLDLQVNEKDRKCQNRIEMK